MNTDPTSTAGKPAGRPATRKGDIIPMYFDTVLHGLEPEGLRIGHAIAVHADGSKLMVAMAFAGDEVGNLIFQTVRKILSADRPAFSDVPDNAHSGPVVELIFGVDRWAKPDQGVEFSDMITVYYFDGRAWRFGVIEYRPPAADGTGQVVKPIEWGNAFWTPIQREELAKGLGSSIQIHKLNRPPIVLAPLGKPPEGITESEAAARLGIAIPQGGESELCS